MKRSIRRTFSLMVAAALAVASPFAQAQQDFPSRTIKVVVPFAAGGGGDTLGRVYAQKLSEALKVPVIVDNRPGASTVIASDLVAKSTPDGCTILLNVPLLIQAPFLLSKVPYDPLTDLTPITDLAGREHGKDQGPQHQGIHRGCQATSA